MHDGMKVRWYGLWSGGSGYGHSDPVQDVECFSAIDAARSALHDRRTLGYSFRQLFVYANRDDEMVHTPCVETDSEIWLFHADNAFDYEGDIALTDVYPDRIVKFGPRGGVVVEMA